MIERRILVTGGTGLVGQAIQRELGKSNALRDASGKLTISSLNESWTFVSSKDADLRCVNETKFIFEKFKPTHCIHLAAVVGGLFRNMREPVSMLEENLLINTNVLRSAHSCGVQKLTACLSTCIFPDSIQNYPITEKVLHAGPPHSSNEGYAYAKRMLEIACRAYSKQFGYTYNCVIPTNIFGEDDNFHLENSHVIPGLIHKCFAAKQKQEDFLILGSGRPLRQFVYSQDLAKIIIWMIREYNELEPLIVCADNIGCEGITVQNTAGEMSIRDVAYIIAQEFDYVGKMKFVGGEDGQHRKTVCNKTLRMKIGKHFAFTPFDVAIRNTVQWFCRHYPQVRC